MKAAFVSFRFYFVTLLFILTAFLTLFSSKTFAQQLEHNAVCEAIYINGTGVPNGGNYPTELKQNQKFHVEIKMKNTGQTTWTSQNRYKLGTSDDPTKWGSTRINLSENTSTVNKDTTGLFIADLIAAPGARATNLPQSFKFDWQMLKERQVDSSGNVIDAGGRFGEICSIQIPIIAEGATPKTEKPVCAQVITPSKNPSTGECKDFPTPCAVPTGWEKVKSCTEPVITSQTACTNSQNNLQKVSANWSTVDAGSFMVFLVDLGPNKDQKSTLTVEKSNCLDSNTKTYTFTKEHPANTNYQVHVMPFTDNSCRNFDISAPSGGYIVDVTNGGFLAPANPASNLTWQIKSISLKIGSTEPKKMSLDTCAGTKFSLTLPTGKNIFTSANIPANILLSRFKAGSNGVIQENQFNLPFPVIFKYRPVIKDEEGNVVGKAPEPAKQPSTEPAPEEGGNAEP